MLPIMNTSKPTLIISSIILMAFLMGACEILSSEGINYATATSVSTLTSVPPTVTPTSTPEVVHATDIPTLLPTPQRLPIFTPDAIQVEQWQEYQTELAKVLLYGYGPDASKDALCEWDIVGQYDQEVYVWVVCALRGGENNRLPAVIYLSGDGTIQSVKVAGYKGPFYDLELFPAEVREKLNVYIFPPYSGGRPRELGQHLEYRQTHLEEPPLVVLSATPAITPMP